MKSQVRKSITTDREVASLALPEGKDRIVVTVKGADNREGLCVEVRGGRSKKSWIYRFYLGGKQTKMTLGSYPAMKLATARKVHAEAAELVKQGIDPRTYQQQKKAMNEAAIDFENLVERWLNHCTEIGVPKANTITAHRNRWERHLKKPLGKIRLIDLTKAHISTALDDMRKKTKEETRKALSTISLALDYGLKRQLNKDNPARLLRPKDFEATMNPPRERWLNVNELRIFWKALDEHSTGSGSKAEGFRGICANACLSLPVVNALKLIILTGCRVGEVCSMRFSDINDGVWTIAETKNGKAHTVYLGKLALSLIDQQHQISNCDYVFESVRNAGVPTTTDNIGKSISRMRKLKPEISEINPFTPHDLRRSAATNWAELFNVEERVIEKMLNHIEQNRLIRTYHRSGHTEQTKAAWLKWDELISQRVAQDPQPEKQITNVIAVNFGR